MHASDILKYGHATFMRSLEGIPDDAWSEPGACGVWSIKDIVAHLASYEQMLGDVLTSVAGEGPTPTLDHMLAHGDTFNDDEVGRRAALSPTEALAEYESACASAQARVAALGEDDLRRAGILSWYGEAYDLEDFLVYAFYGHKREHSAQVMVQRDRLGIAAG